MFPGKESQQLFAMSIKEGVDVTAYFFTLVYSQSPGSCPGRCPDPLLPAAQPYGLQVQRVKDRKIYHISEASASPAAERGPADN